MDRAHKFSENRFKTGLSSGSDDGAEVEVWLSGENPYTSSSSMRRARLRGRRGRGTGALGPVGAGGPATRKKDDPEHLQVQGGVGDVRHYYTSPHGANDALHEWVTQVVGRLHRAAPPERRERRGAPDLRPGAVQPDHRQFTVSFGGQESYVFALPANLQLSFWAQLTAGQNVSGGTTQESLAAGTQLAWQPADWLSFGVQGGVGPTVQSQGPSSIDRSGLIFFQIQQ